MPQNENRPKRCLRSFSEDKMKDIGHVILLNKVNRDEGLRASLDMR